MYKLLFEYVERGRGERLCPTWIAHYYVDTLEVNQTWTFWQCSDRGRLPGISKNVDINIFNGNLKTLENFKKK